MTYASEEVVNDIEARAETAMETLVPMLNKYEAENAAHYDKEDPDNPGEVPYGEEASRAAAGLEIAQKVLDRLASSAPLTEETAERLETKLKGVEDDIEDLPAVPDDDDDDVDDLA